MQIALYTAQREYARTGDKNLSDVLIDILVDRAAQQDRTLKQIVLDEALSVAPKLAGDQYDILSVCFSLRYTKANAIASLPLLDKYFRETVLPFASPIPRHNAPYQHLQYAGCASIRIGEIQMGEIFRLNYPGLFCKGFTREEFARSVAPPEGWFGALLIPALHDPRLLQVAALDVENIQARCQSLGLSAELTTAVQTIQERHLMSENEIEDYIGTHIPGAKAVVEGWKNSSLQHLALTSVGIATAHANIRHRIKAEYNLSIWIP